MAFYVNQQVICVNDEDGAYHSHLGAGAAAGLRKGQVYTIASINDPFLRLAEFGIEHGWDKCRFRPVVDTDISIFIAMLTPKKVTEDA